MKKRSEVCKIVGVTRRTLQEYNKIGLLCPTYINKESNYWFYDDDAIQKLILIQIFREGGYERKNIKTILEASEINIFAELDKLSETLVEKRQKIDGMLKTIDFMKVTTKLPDSTIMAMRNLNMEWIYKDKNFTNYLKESIEHFAEYNEIDNKEMEIYVPFWYKLIAIGCFKGTDIDNDEVQVAVNEAFKSGLEILEFDKKNEEDTISAEEFEKRFAEEIQVFLSDRELKEMIEQQCGEGAAEYIIQAAQVFSNKVNAQ